MVFMMTEEANMTTYSVYMVNFDMIKGTFNSANEAIEQATKLGFECSILVNVPGKTPLHLCNVKPY